MAEKIKIFLWSISCAIIIVVFGILYLQKNNNDRYPLFIDGRGKVVDPYLQREVINTVSVNSRSVQICYNALVEKFNKNNSLKTDGTVHLDWIIDAQGKSKNIRVVSSQLTDSEFQNCLLSSIESWHFPSPGQERYAEHKFDFKRRTEVNP